MSVDAWALLISVLSFGVSGVALYRSELSPFKLIVAVGTPAWRLERMGTGEKQTDVVTLTVPMALTNGGAKMGVVRDMLVGLYREGKVDHLVPTFFAGAGKHLGGIAAQDSLVPTQEPLFRPVILKGHEQTEKTIVFLPEREITLSPGGYSVSLNVKAVSVGCEEVEWESHFIGSFQLTTDDLTEMDRGLALEKVSDEIRSGRISILGGR